MVLDLQARYPSPSSGSYNVPFSCYPTSDVDCIVGLFFSLPSPLSSTQCNFTNGTFGVTPRFFHNLQVELSGAENWQLTSLLPFIFFANQHRMFQFPTMTLDFMIS
jgi:hypothetical protein